MIDKFDKIEPVTTAHHLSTKELARLVTTSKKHRALFKPLLDARKLLHHVVRGEHDAVKAMLGQDITLLFKRSIVTDLSGRTFEPISPFEYALWALDKHMWDTMLACIPQSEKGNEVLVQLRSQYKALQKKGLTYRLNENPITELHFDLQNILIKELETQIDSFRGMNPQNWEPIANQWIKGVGGAQRLLPVHVVNEYCVTPSLNPPPAFNSYPGSSQQFYNSITEQNENWFDEDSKLGIDFGIYGAGGDRIGSGIGWGGAVVKDIIAMRALCKVRTNDFTNLESQLDAMPMFDNTLPLAKKLF